jgi:hypothetical protein
MAVAETLDTNGSSGSRARSERGGTMTAFLVFTGCEPFIVMTPRSAVRDGRLSEALTRRGFEKFIARELPLDALRDSYGLPFEVIESEIRQGKDLRVLDYSGAHVFDTVSLEDLGACIRCEGGRLRLRGESEELPQH